MASTVGATENVSLQLPNIEAPQEAIAETHQRKCFSSMVPPRGIVVRFQSSTPTTFLAPHPQSAFWFKEIYDGYMSAQTVSYSKFATDNLKLITSENLELELAHKDPTRCVDESLPPRRCAIWILANGGNTSSPVVNHALDALSLWATFKPNGNERVVNKIRMSAAFNQDADFVLQSFSTEIVGELTNRLHNQQIVLLLRWHNGVNIQTVMRDISHYPGLSHPQNAIRCVQDTAVRIAGTYDAPLPSLCMKAVPHELDITQCFYKHIHDTSNEFFKLLVGDPSITFSDHTRTKNASRILQPTGSFVRVVNKSLGKDGISSPTCFHGVVLGLSHKRVQIKQFIESRSDEHGIQVPTSMEELELGLHLCAVQAEGWKMKNLITLFGTMGVAGKSIHSPGSWVWVARPAVRPIQADLLHVFELHICHIKSLLPGKLELVPAFERFWERTTDVFKLISNGETSFDAKNESNFRSDSPTLVHEMKLNDFDTAMLALMQIDMKSERTTLGDAYASLTQIPSADTITQNMKQVMASLGVRASLYDMWQFNSRASQHFRTQDDTKRASDGCLRKLCEIALDMACDRKRLKTSAEQTPLCLTADRMRRVLKACSLKGEGHITLSKGNEFSIEQENALYNIVAASLWVTSAPKPEIVHLIKRPFVKLLKTDTNCPDTEWVQNVQNAFAASASVAAVALGSTDSITFLVFATLNENEVFIKQINLNGSIEASSMDIMCQIVNPKVVILQQIESGKVRATATVRSS